MTASTPAALRTALKAHDQFRGESKWSRSRVGAMCAWWSSMAWQFVALPELDLTPSEGRPAGSLPRRTRPGHEGADTSAAPAGRSAPRRPRGSATAATRGRRPTAASRPRRAGAAEPSARIRADALLETAAVVETALSTQEHPGVARAGCLFPGRASTRCHRLPCPGTAQRQQYYPPVPSLHCTKTTPSGASDATPVLAHVAFVKHCPVVRAVSADRTAQPLDATPQVLVMGPIALAELRGCATHP